jgi:hypothetical protein
MDKVEFAIESRKEMEVGFGDKKIMVLPYIPQSSKLNLAQQYIEFMFGNPDMTSGYYQAEWAIIVGLLTDCTNINVTENNIDNIISSGLWDAIKSKIENYQEFRNDLRLVAKNKADQIALDKSFGQALDKISNKVIEFLDNIGKVDLSADGIKKLTDQLSSSIKEVEDKFPGATTHEARKPRKKKEEPKAD